MGEDEDDDEDNDEDVDIYCRPPTKILWICIDRIKLIIISIIILQPAA